MKKNKIFNKYERRIISALYAERRPLTISQIKQHSGLSWITVKKWVKKLEGRYGLVRKYNEINKPEDMAEARKVERYREKWVLDFQTLRWLLGKDKKKN